MARHLALGGTSPIVRCGHTLGFGRLTGRALGKRFSWIDSYLYEFINVCARDYPCIAQMGGMRDSPDHEEAVLEPAPSTFVTKHRENMLLRGTTNREQQHDLHVDTTRTRSGTRSTNIVGMTVRRTTRNDG